MLTNSRNSYSIDEEVDFIHNYYERLVLQEIYQQSSRVQVGDREFLADVACVALNRLPPRYIRHDVDMTFFMSPLDMQEIEHKVTNAVAIALDYVEKRERGDDAELPPFELPVNIDKTESAEKTPKEKKAPAKKTAPKAKPAKKKQ